MPKASAEATLKVRIQARELYETGKYTLEQICQIIKKSGGSLTRQTLSKWINEDPTDIRTVGDKKENPEKQKEALQPLIKEAVQKAIESQEQEKQELQPPENTPPPPPKKKSLEEQKQEQKEHAKKIDELTNAITEQFFEEEKLKECVLSTGLLGMQRIRQVLLTNKQYYKNEEQAVGLQSATHYLRLAEAYERIAETLGFGASKGINIFNQNNTNVQHQKAETDNLPLDSVLISTAHAILSNVLPQHRAKENDTE